MSLWLKLLILSCKGNWWLRWKKMVRILLLFSFFTLVVSRLSECGHTQLQGGNEEQGIKWWGEREKNSMVFLAQIKQISLPSAWEAAEVSWPYSCYLCHQQSLAMGCAKAWEVFVWLSTSWEITCGTCRSRTRGWNRKLLEGTKT